VIAIVAASTSFYECMDLDCVLCDCTQSATSW
jgi:hypothetical protein